MSADSSTPHPASVPATRAHVTDSVPTAHPAGASDSATGSGASALARAAGRWRPRTFFGHPLGLANLFGVEMWERFSFYGIQAVLTFYIYYEVTAGGLGYSKEIAYSIGRRRYGLPGVHCGPWVCDRWFGAARSLIGAGVIIMLAPFPSGAGPAGAGYWAGAFIACGAGTQRLLPDGTGGSLR